MRNVYRYILIKKSVTPLESTILSLLIIILVFPEKK